MPSSVGSWVFRGHKDFAAVHRDLALAAAVACPAVDAAALKVGGMAFLNGDREVQTVALLVAWAEKLQQALETCQVAQQGLGPGGLSPGGDAVGLLATGCWRGAAGAPVSTPVGRCRSWSAAVAMMAPVPITSPSVA